VAMNWPRLFSVGAHAALIAWLYYLSTLPLPPLITPVLQVDLVEPVYKPPPPPPPVMEPPKEMPKEPPKPRRARVRPRAAPPPPPSPEPAEVAPLPIPPAPPTPADAPIEPTETFIKDPEPVYRPKPDYPERALRFNREGYVEVEFTIAADGSVRDVKVLKAEPPGVFDRSVLRAVAKWKFDPQLVNGVPVDRPGVVKRVVFKLEKS
jgi:protein TonB